MSEQRPRCFVGLHIVAQASAFARCMVSVNRLLQRQRDFTAGEWILDSGAFSRLTTGTGHLPMAAYAAQVRRWARCGTLVAAVCQDWMCEPWVLQRTGLSVAEHQRLTLENFRALAPLVAPTYCMPVVQGVHVDDYRTHVAAYGALLAPGAWVGLGSVCKRQGSVGAIEDILGALSRERPDLRWHGFGLKRTALGSALVSDTLWSFDTMAWSYAARCQGRDPNAVEEALRYLARLDRIPVQGLLPFD